MEVVLKGPSYIRSEEGAKDLCAGNLNIIMVPNSKDFFCCCKHRDAKYLVHVGFEMKIQILTSKIKM